MTKYLLEECPMRKTLATLSGKWKLLLLDTFREERTRRFGELKRVVPDISEKMLIQELKALVDADLLVKKSYPEVPPKVEYTLTKRGEKVFPIIDAYLQFSALTAD